MPDYRRIYDDFIQSRRGLEDELVLFEKHHILPISLGGGNDSTNLIKLSLRDHLFAHLLLWKLYRGKMAQALHMMTTSSNRFGGFSKSRAYAAARSEVAQMLSEKMRGNIYGAKLKGIPHSAEHNKNVSLALRGNKNGAGPGRKYSEEAKLQRSLIMTGKKASPEARAARSRALKGKPWSNARRIAEDERKKRV